MEYKSCVFMENSLCSFGIKDLKIISLKNYDNTFNNSHNRNHKIQPTLLEILDSEEEDPLGCQYGYCFYHMSKKDFFKSLKLMNEICAYGRDKGNSGNP